MNINFANSRRPPDRNALNDAVMQTQRMMSALFQPHEDVTLSAREGRRDTIRKIVPAGQLADDAARFSLDRWERDFRLLVDVVRAERREVPVGHAPTSSFLPPDIPVLVVTFPSDTDGIVRALQSMAVPPNVIVDAAQEVHAAWKLDELINRDEHGNLANRIRSTLRAGSSFINKTEIPLPGFSGTGQGGPLGQLVGSVVNTVRPLKALRAMELPSSKN